MAAMDVRPIRNEADYDWALREIERSFVQEPRRGTKEAARFEFLATLIEADETKHWLIEPPNPSRQSAIA
ncbi:MAG TPA: hypothetical protein VGL35_10350 [Rhizomicrobium sp.]|jgi:HTH-type transcriptional regulator/antitoxin HigA